MSPKINTTLLSAAVISGLLVSAAPAQATETTDDALQSITVAQQETQTEPAAPAATEAPVQQPAVETPVVPAPPVAEVPADNVEDIAVEAPAEQTVVPEPQAPVEDSVEETAPAAPVEENASVEDSAPAQDLAAGTETGATQPADETSSATDETVDSDYIEGVESDKDSLASFLESEAVQQLSDEFGDLDSDISEEEQAFWEKVDALLPEGSEGWDDAQWDAFYETEEGQQLLQLIEEEFGTEDPEISDEDLQFLEEMMDRLPAGAEEWTDEQWGEFFATEDGQEYLALVLTYLLDSVSSEAELEELLESIWAEFPGDQQWLEDFLAFYFGEEAPEGEKPEAKPEAKPSEKPVEIKPAGSIDKKPENTGSESAKGDAKPQASEN